jgi:hypothetical protein
VANYGKELTKAKDEILSLVAGARVQSHDLARSHDALFADELRKIFNRIKFISAFYGIQKLTDLSHWAVRYLDFLLEQQHLTEFPPELFEKILDRSIYLIENLDLPKSYGEFIKPTGVTVRPLFKKRVETMDLQNELAKQYPLSMAKKSIYRLPVVLGKGYPYSLRVPSRFINKRDRDDTYLSLVYCDLFRLNNGWEEWLNFFNEATDKGMILFQGSLELPVEKFQRQSDILPYYFLLQSLEPPRRFLRGKGMAARVIKVLQGPGSDLLVKGDLDDDSEWETPIDIDTPVVSAPGLEKNLEPLEEVEQVDSQEPTKSKVMSQGFREENMVKTGGLPQSPSPAPMPASHPTVKPVPSPRQEASAVATLERPVESTKALDKSDAPRLETQPVDQQNLGNASVTAPKAQGESLGQTALAMDQANPNEFTHNQATEATFQSQSSEKVRRITTNQELPSNELNDQESQEEYPITSEEDRPKAAEIPFTVQDLAQKKNLPRRAPNDEELLEIIRRKDLVAAVFEEPGELSGLDMEELPEGEGEVEDLDSLETLEAKSENPANTMVLTSTGEPSFGTTPEAAAVQAMGDGKSKKKRLWPGSILIVFANLFILTAILYALWHLPFQVVPQRMQTQAEEVETVLQAYAGSGADLLDINAIEDSLRGWDELSFPWQLVTDTNLSAMSQVFPDDYTSVSTEERQWVPNWISDDHWDYTYKITAPFGATVEILQERLELWDILDSTLFSYFQKTYGRDFALSLPFLRAVEIPWTNLTFSPKIYELFALWFGILMILLLWRHIAG